MNQTALKKLAETWLPEAAAVVLAVIALRKGNPYGIYVFLRWMPALSSCGSLGRQEVFELFLRRVVHELFK